MPLVGFGPPVGGGVWLVRGSSPAGVAWRALPHLRRGLPRLRVGWQPGVGLLFCMRNVLLRLGAPPLVDVSSVAQRPRS